MEGEHFVELVTVGSGGEAYFSPSTVVMMVWMLERGRVIGLVIFKYRMPTICFEVII